MMRNMFSTSDPAQKAGSVSASRSASSHSPSQHELIRQYEALYGSTNLIDTLVVPLYLALRRYVKCHIVKSK